MNSRISLPWLSRIPTISFHIPIFTASIQRAPKLAAAPLLDAVPHAMRCVCGAAPELAAPAEAAAPATLGESGSAGGRENERASCLAGVSAPRCERTAAALATALAVAVAAALAAGKVGKVGGEGDASATRPGCPPSGDLDCAAARAAAAWR